MRQSLAYCARLSLNGLSTQLAIVIVHRIMSWLTFAPKLPHCSRIAALLEKMPRLTETKLVGITDYGYCEVSGNTATHFRFSLPTYRTPTLIFDTQDPVVPSFTYTLAGTDSWIPVNATLTTVSRTTISFEGGLEYRTEETNGIRTEHWWVPSNKQEAFELFIKDNGSK